MASHPELITALIEELQGVNDWAESHRGEVAVFLAELLELDEQVLRVAEQKRVYGVETMSPESVAYQQRVADTFMQLGLLPGPVNVADVIWTPK